MKNYDESVKTLLTMFANQDFPQQVAWSIIRRDPAEPSVPSDSWSVCNRLIMRICGGTDDARTFKQWISVGRHVKKGAKAFHIFAPIVKKELDEESGKEIFSLRGFKTLPVFALEDTEGEVIYKHDYQPLVLPPLTKVAEALGIKVYWKPIDKSRSALGYYRPADKSITLYVEDSTVFYHELGHAVHDSFEPMHSIDGNYAEVVAELVSAVLCVMHGEKGYEQQSWLYLQRFTATKDSKATLKAITGVLNTVEKVVNIITATACTL